MNISRFKRPYWHRLRQRRINALEPINWERVHEMLITDLDTLSAANKSCIEMKRLSLEENHYRWERGTLVGFSEKIPNRNPDVKEKIFTPLYSEWISYDCKDKNYVVGVLSPGKEAHSDWKHNRYDKSGESSCNHNDVLPTILLDGKVAFKPLTFEEIFDGFARMVHNDKLAAFILRHILLRMAFCIDHELDGGNVRWKPPQEIMDIIYQRIPVILINDEWSFPTEIFLHLIEVLAINEDSKVFTLGNDSKSHQVSLSTYDLLRAQVIEIRDANPVTNYLTNNSDDYKLFEQWKAFRKIIEPNLTKDSQKNNFFSRYFMSKSLPHADPNKQFKELLDENFDPVTRLWNKGPVTALLQELTNFLEWNQEIKQLGTTIPTNRHEEEFYLLLFPNSFKQWIPVYLAARNKFKNPKSQESINSLLRHIAEFWGKGNSLPKMCDDIPSIPPNKFFQKVPIWCQEINNLSDAPTNADVKSVLNGIKTDIDSLLTPINWTIANLKTDTSGNTRKFSGSNSDIKFILATIEKKLGGISDGSGRFRDGMINSDVEHILEKNLAFANKSADFVFNNTNFETSKQRLGNRLLFPKKSNNHIKGKSFVLKMHDPTCNIGNCVSGSLHYSSHNNRWKLVEKFLHKYQTPGVWNSSNIDSWEDTLIDLYHGCW